MKKFLMLALVLAAVFTAAAQKTAGTVKGTLLDSTSAQGIPDATVSISSSKDSTLVSFMLTSNSGFFEIKNLEAGSYYLQVSYQGFENLVRSFEITPEKPVADFGAISMSRQYKLLQEVIVQDVPVKIKGDTIAYNASSFKTKPNATAEDLLKKLPGVQVDRDGTVKAQGENVQKVYVDGKEFFGSDPKQATKNLSADMIAEVEVYDDMSEQAKFNGIDDGSRSKAINLKLKKEKKRGTFGRAQAGYGTNERYMANLRTNFFKGATQVTLLANGNNTNNLNFTSTDMLGMSSFGGGGGNFMMRGGPAPSLGGSGNGITSSLSAGLNYNDTWNKYFDISSSYNINHSSIDNLRKSFRQTYFTDSTIDRNQDMFSRNANNVNRFNMRLTYNINERNSIVYSPNINFQNSEGFRNDTVSSFVDRNDNYYKLNETRTHTQNTGNGINWSNNLLWRRKFAKGGRTLSVNLSNTYNRSERESFNQSVLRNFNGDGLKVKDSSFNQKNGYNSQVDNYALTLSYTEPIGRDKIWEWNYTYSNNENISDRTSFELDPGTGKFDQVNNQLTNYFENSSEYNRLGTNFRILKKKYNYQLGLAAQHIVLQSNNISKAKFIEQKSVNLFPTASFNYQFARSKSLRFNYRGRTNQPSATQLQDVPDLSDPNNITQGNPALQQEFSNNVTLTYNFFDMVKFRNMFFMLGYNNTYNKIVNSTQQLGFGRQLTTPVNVDGVYNINGNFNIGFPIKKMQGGNVNTTTRVNFNRDASMIDGLKNYIKNLTLGEDLRVNYNFKEKLDLGVTASVNYTSAQYTIQPQRNNAFFTHIYSADLTYTMPKGFIVSTDIDYTAYTGRSDGFNQQFTMWNASLGKQLFKNRKGELKLSVFDILNQNVSLTRNTSDNYVEDIQTNVVQRFVMLSLTYNINRMGGKNMPGPGNNGGRRMMMQ
jgi:hypothetical protein